MYEDWTDMETARSWSADTTTHNPVRVEQLEILMSILEDESRPGTAILDVGMGSGLVEAMLFERIPGAFVVGLDSSQAMVGLAHERLAQYADRYEMVMHDLRDIGGAKLPEREYSAAISVQTIHNVANEHKRATFRFVHDALANGGMFLLVDRVAVDTPGLFDCYTSMWRRQERVYGAQLRREGATFEEHRETLKGRGDLPASLEWHLNVLRETGFEVACLHLHANRALFAARKS